MRAKHLLLGSLVSLALSSVVAACLWDRDTLEMERKRFPDVMELITGRFLRHTPEFYQWRIENRKRRIAADPDQLALYDDLAVAQDKTGQHKQAIATILDKDQRKPGLYETNANLGTFHIHNGELKQGLGYIRKAIEINPDAHFGREVYQQLLVEYVLERQGDADTPSLPLNTESRLGKKGFVAFVAKQRGLKTGDDAYPEEMQKALKGVLGMMRFGNHDSPILLEALGDLLIATTPGREDAKRLATRAYLKASYEVEDDQAKQGYRKLAEQSLRMQTELVGYNQLKLRTVERRLKEELREAQRWWNSGIRRDELKWIADDVDVDAEFARKYYRAAPSVKPMSVKPTANSAATTPRSSEGAAVPAPARSNLLTVALTLTAVTVAALGTVYFFKSRR